MTKKVSGANPKVMKKRSQKAKPANHSTSPDPITKQYDSYLEYGTYRQIPVNEAFIERLSADLINWVETDPNAFKIMPFFRKHKICCHSVKQWRKKFPLFNTAVESALFAIGDKRELGAGKVGYEKTFDPMVWERMRRYYDPMYKEDWQEDEKYLGSVKSPEGGNSVFTVSLNAVPDTGVPTIQLTPEEVANQVRMTQTLKRKSKKYVKGPKT